MPRTGAALRGFIRPCRRRIARTISTDWLVLPTIRRFREENRNKEAISEAVFGETVSFSCAKLYNCQRITEALSFGKDEGSANRRGAEPSVFFCGCFLAADIELTKALFCAKISRRAGDWRSGSAGPLQGQGRRFKSCIAHHRNIGPEHHALAFLLPRFALASDTVAVDADESDCLGYVSKSV